MLDTIGGGDRSYLGGLLGTLKVTLLRAEGLLLTDEVGENDSYVEFIGAAGDVRATSCIIESLAPDWDAAHKRLAREQKAAREAQLSGEAAPAPEASQHAPCSCFASMDAVADTVERTTECVFPIRHVDATRHVALWFWDEDPIGRDFNGEVRISIAELLAGFQRGLPFASPTLSVPLAPREGEDDPNIKGKRAGELGNAMYRYEWAPTEHVDESHLQEEVMRSPLGVLTDVQPLPELSRAALVPCALKFTVHWCRWLINRDAVGLSDPYVCVHDPAEEEVFRTCVIDDTLAPDWADTMCEGLVHVTSAAATRADVTLRVWDMDTSNSDFLGEVRLPLAVLLAHSQSTAAADSGPIRVVAQLQPRPQERDSLILGSDFLGAICFSYEYLDVGETETHGRAPHPSALAPLAPEFSPSGQPGPSRLSVSVKGCTYLASRGALDIPSPMLEVWRYAGEGGSGTLLYASTVHESTTSPDFRALIPCFTASSPDEDCSEALAATVLHFVVLDAPQRGWRASGSPRPIATIALSLLDLLHRISYAAEAHARSGAAANERALCLQLQQAEGGTASKQHLPPLNKEGPGAYGSLFLWASFKPIPAADFPLALSLPSAGPSFSAASVYVWACGGLHERRTGSTPFVRVFLDSAATTKKGPEILRTPLSTGGSPRFGTRGVVGTFPLGAAMAAASLSTADEAALASHLLTFSVVDGNPRGDEVLGQCTVTLARLLQLMAAAGGRRDGLPCVSVPLLDHTDLSRKAYASLRLVDRANILGRPHSGQVYVWASLQ